MKSGLRLSILSDFSGEEYWWYVVRQEAIRREGFMGATTTKERETVQSEADMTVFVEGISYARHKLFQLWGMYTMGSN